MDELIQAILDLPKFTPLERKQVIESIVIFLQSIAAIWLETMQSEISADDLIPLIAELLPNNPSQLEFVLIRLEEANNHETEGINSAALTNLYSAVYSKLHKPELIDNTSLPDATSLDHIILVANQVCWQIDLVKIKKACIAYKNHLGAQTIAHPDDTILQGQYLTLLDMIHTLQDKKQPRYYRLLIFSEKFAHCKHIFKTGEKNAIALFFKDFSHTLGLDKLAKLTPEDIFLKTVGDLVQKFMLEHLASQATPMVTI